MDQRTPLDDFHDLQMAANWAAAADLLAEEFVYQDLGLRSRLSKAAYIDEYTRKYPDVWSDEPISAVTQHDERKGCRLFFSASPNGQHFIVWSDAEWNQEGRLTALREVWHLQDSGT